MKTILAATHFSPASRSAAVYGAELAVRFNSRLILFNAYQPIPVDNAESMAILGSEEMKKITVKLLDHEVHFLKSRYSLPIEYGYAEGNISHSILSYAKETKTNLIIIGMKEFGKRFRKIFGTTVISLARRSDIPILVIPENAKFTDIDTIALATDTDVPARTSNHVVELLKEIGERFHSKVYMVRVVNKNFSDASKISSRPGKLFKMLHTLDPLYQCFEGEEVSTVLVKFLKGYHVNLLAVMPRTHSPLERWFGKRVTRTMVFESRIPLLILPETAIVSSKARNTLKEDSFQT